MSNAAALLLSALLDIACVSVAARLGTTWLYSTIVFNLLMVTIFGAKLVSVFGFVTNAGNVFYACVFLATHFLLLRNKRREALTTIWLGASMLILFTALSQLIILIPSGAGSEAAASAMATLFSLSPRITLASVLGFIFAQRVNIYVYERIGKTHGQRLWLQSTGANIVAQLVDSSLFFTIAFIDLPSIQLLQAIIIGTTIKVAVVLLGVPMLYLEHHFKPARS